MVKNRTLEEINQKLTKGTAIVMTAEELCNLIRENQKISIDDIDVVTTATKGLMSGTIAILSFRVSEAAVFKKAKELYLNDVPCYVGPCPNEFLGVIDSIVYGVAHSISRPEKYGGGHLFRDLIENKEINVKVKTVEGDIIETTTKLNDIPFAKMVGIRNAFKNYLAFVNPHSEDLNTIFSAVPFKGNLAEATVCGCGELNPIQKDPDLDIIGVGTPILMNGAIGYIIGEGTRSSKEKPNLMAIAEMHGMDPEYSGGFITSSGPEVINSWALAIPILNEKIFQNVIKTDEDIKLVITDVKGRKPLEKTTYAAIWQNVDLQISYDKEKCIECTDCVIEKKCPMSSFSQKEGINRSLCFNCGTCINLCSGKAFKGNLGTITISARDIPIITRQSDRFGALKLANELKEKILSGEFKLSLPVSKFDSVQ
ncbi:MAG: methanogenesis marker 16 metalloprotein [Candidatus Helarchaeota archaeon]|nr:methanogenesis marker 16 metalloprotein [Candidatus Helarchaeota archaeon]